jgi:hypothetical protein
MTSTTLAASDTAAASSYTTVMDHVAQAFEVLGTLILAIGVLWSFVLAVLAWRRSRSGQRACTVLRQAFGGTLLLALEVRSGHSSASPWRSKSTASGHGGGHWPAEPELSNRPPRPRSSPARTDRGLDFRIDISDEGHAARTSASRGVGNAAGRSGCLWYHLAVHFWSRSAYSPYLATPRDTPASHPRPAPPLAYTQQRWPPRPLRAARR